MDGGLVLILEDDWERVRRFGEVVRGLGLEMVVWRSAREMIREVAGYLGRARVISLDHDLYPGVGEEGVEMGDGVEVAYFLARVGVGCPVVIHSSNGERAGMMLGELERVGVRVKTVLPLGEEWVERYWAGVVREMVEGGEGR